MTAWGPFPPPLQTTDWFASIQRCFQWSERVEQLPMNSMLLNRATNGGGGSGSYGAGPGSSNGSSLGTGGALDSTLTSMGSMLSSVEADV